MVAAANAFVTKFNPSGSALVYSTYLGGSGNDGGSSIAVDGSGNAYVTGGTSSTDFPTTPGAFQTTGTPGFVTKLSPAGSGLVYSTYLSGGGSSGIAVDSAGDAYVTGTTICPNTFPTTPGAFQTTCTNGTYTGFVAKFNSAGSALIYATFLGGGVDQGSGYTTLTVSSGIAVDNIGNAYLAGWTTSTTFPTTPGAFQTVCSVCGQQINNAFVTKLDPTGSSLVYSTYLGGGIEAYGQGISVDGSGNAYVTGYTGGDFPVTPGAFQTTIGGSADAFVTKFNPSGSALVYSTYLGGSGQDFGSGIAVDSAGNAYVTGYTQSKYFPRMNPLQKFYGGGFYDAFVTRFNPTGSALVYSTYLGGSGLDVGSSIAVDGSGNAYVTGSTSSADFPTTPGAFQTTCCGAFVAKIFIAAATTTRLASSPNPSIYGQAVTFTAVVSSSAGTPPDGETVTFKKGTAVLGTGTLNGGSANFTTSALPVGTNAIKVVYSGDSNFAASASKWLNQVVNKATTTTALASSQNPSNFGQSVTFTATMTPQFGGTVKGSVTFYDGTTVLKTVALSGGAAKFTTSTLTSGAHNITATYNGSASFTGSSASLTQTVN